MTDYRISTSVAEHILWLRRDRETTPMHVIKLAYLSHGWGLGWGDGPLIDEPVEAWTYGPVIPSIYQRYRSFGGDSIRLGPINRESSFNQDQIETMKVVTDFYADKSAVYLSNLTHINGSPWSRAVENWGVGCIIPNELIEKYYRDLAEKA